MDNIIEKIKDLQYLVRELAIDYFCFDAKITFFYTSDPYKIYELIDKEAIPEFKDTMKDMIEYYELSDDDAEVLNDEVNLFIKLLS